MTDLPIPPPAEPRDAEHPPLAVRSQWALFRRRFVRHKLAMVSVLYLAIVVLAAWNVDLLTPYAYDEPNVSIAGTPPTLRGGHLLGTDQIGRDYLTRVLHGARTSLQVASVVAVLSTLIGVTVGGLAGYYRGWLDSLLMRLTDLVIILPLLAVVLVAATLYGQGSPMRIAVALALLYWTVLARIVRGVFLSLREEEFVQAARACGARDLRIIVRHLLPNAIGSIVVNLTLVLASAIIVEATLAYLGFGVNPPTPALGLLISDGRSAMQSRWWLVVMPGVMLVSISLAINFIGDGLRDALDPTQPVR